VHADDRHVLQIPNVTEHEGMPEGEGATISRATGDVTVGTNSTLALSLSDLDCKVESKPAAAESPPPTTQLIITHHHHHHTKVTREGERERARTHSIWGEGWGGERGVCVWEGGTGRLLAVTKTLRMPVAAELVEGAFMGVLRCLDESFKVLLWEL